MPPPFLLSRFRHRLSVLTKREGSGAKKKKRKGCRAARQGYGNGTKTILTDALGRRRHLAGWTLVRSCLICVLTGEVANGDARRQTETFVPPLDLLTLCYRLPSLSSPYEDEKVDETVRLFRFPFRRNGQAVFVFSSWLQDVPANMLLHFSNRVTCMSVNSHLRLLHVEPSSKLIIQFA